MDFQITEEHEQLRQRRLELAEDFATRATTHDREASHPTENYAILQKEGFYALDVPQDLGGWDVGYPWHARDFCLSSLGTIELRAGSM